MFNRLTCFFKQPQPSKQIASFSVEDAEHNTKLHHMVRRCKDANELITFLNTTGIESASTMARTVNDKGQLALDLINESKASNEEKEKLYSILTPYMLANSLNKLSDMIDAKKILANYSSSPSSQIYRNIELSCSVVNECRETIKQSWTHPQANSLNLEERNSLATKILQMRESQKCDLIKVIVTHPMGLLFDTQNTICETIAERPLKNGIGNCGEFAFVAFHFLKKRDSKISAEIYTVKKGDHAVLVIGEGDDAVVCDAWAGEVYPAKDIPQKLGCYKYYSGTPSCVNVVTTYNPRFHQAAPDVGLNLSICSYKLLMAGLTYLTSSALNYAIAAYRC